MRSLLLATVISISLAGCYQDGPRDDGAVGSAVARISTVPPMVGCVSLTVVGANRSVVTNFDVVPGQSATLRAGNLPVGSDAFSAAAYATKCSGIVGAQANWASTAPFFAPISQGGVTSLTLTLEPTGAASIGINFDTDGGAGGCGDGGCVGGDGGFDGGGFDGGGFGDGGVNDLSPNFGDGGGGNFDGGIFDLAQQRG